MGPLPGSEDAQISLASLSCTATLGAKSKKGSWFLIFSVQGLDLSSHCCNQKY